MKRKDCFRSPYAFCSLFQKGRTNATHMGTSREISFDLEQLCLLDLMMLGIPLFQTALLHIPEMALCMGT